LTQLRRIGDRTGSGAVIHVALTARREPHSGFVSRLKEPERAEPERQQCEESPGARFAPDHQESHQQRGCSERDESESTPLRLPARSDVRDDGDG
jgi:hypothetical protein